MLSLFYQILQNFVNVKKIKFSLVPTCFPLSYWLKTRVSVVPGTGMMILEYRVTITFKIYIILAPGEMPLVCTLHEYFDLKEMIIL